MKTKPKLVQPSVAEVVRQFEPQMLEFQKRAELIEMFRDICEGVITDGRMRKQEEKGE